jgi:hypothetical protein
MLKSVFIMNVLSSTLMIKLGILNAFRADDTYNEIDTLGVGAMMPHDVSVSTVQPRSDVYGV